MSKINYPPFCKTLSDKNAYRVAHKNGWTKWVHNISDILAIKAGCWFDLEAAQRVEKFFLILRHSKGEWAGQKFVLQPYQRDRIIYPLFGWKRPDGTRRFRKGMIFIPKKAGKSTLAAGISLYLLVADREGGAEVYNCGVDRSNAMNVFTEAMNMVRASPALSKKLEVFPGIKRINYPGTKSWYQTLSADAATAEGKNIHGLIYDELHAAKGDQLFAALSGGGISRRQPLALIITTAGEDTQSLCFKEYEYAKAVIAGDREDWTYFAFVAEAEPGDDPADPVALARANPGLGVSPKTEALLELWAKAKGFPDLEAKHKRYHMNLWVQRAESAIPLELWDKGGTPFNPQELLGRTCYGGCDIGAVSDLTAFVLVFPMDDGTFRLLPHFWCPEDRSRDRGQKKVSYLKWLEDGLMIATPGNVTDYDYVRADINRICSLYDVKRIGLDHQFQGMQLATDLASDGLPITTYSNSPALIAPPTRTFMELVIAGRLLHNANPILRWMAGNLVMKRSPWGELLPDKAKSHEKIDGISGIIMGLGVMGVKSDASVYETRDLLILGGDGDGSEEEKPPVDAIKRVASVKLIKPVRPILVPG